MRRCKGVLGSRGDITDGMNVCCVAPAAHLASAQNGRKGDERSRLSLCLSPSSPPRSFYARYSFLLDRFCFSSLETRAYGADCSLRNPQGRMLVIFLSSLSLSTCLSSQFRLRKRERKREPLFA